MYIITARRMISGLVLKYRKGGALGHLARLGNRPILLKNFTLTKPPWQVNR